MIHDMNLFLETICVIVVAILAYKLARRGEKNTNFDERMEIVRGKGCKHAFLTMLLLLGICALFPGPVTRLGFTISLTCFLIICAGVFVFAAYTLWYDAYFAVNESKKQFLLLLPAIAFLNLIGALHNESPLLCTQFFISCTFFAIFVVSIIKTIKEKVAASEDEGDVE